MARLSFLEAKSLVSDCSYSHLEEISSQRHIVLSPKFLGNIKNGVAAQLNSELQLLAKWTDGVLIAYNNVKIVDRVGRILDEAPYIHFNIQADFIVFKPTVGCRLKGVVNKKSPNHVGCLVHRCFNASIPKPHDLMVEWKGSHLQLGDEFIFEVKQIFVHNGVMSLRGILRNERLLKKKKKSKSKSEQKVEDSTQEDECNQSKGDNSISDLTHNDSGIEVPLYSKHKKKKKTKHSDNEEVLEMSVSPKQKKNKNKIQKHKNDTNESDALNWSVDSDLSFNGISSKKHKIKQEKGQLKEAHSTSQMSRKRKHLKMGGTKESLNVNNVLSANKSAKKKKRIKLEPVEASTESFNLNHSSPKKKKKRQVDAV